MKRGMWIGKMIVLGIIAIGVFGWLTMLLWNWLVPDLFHGPVITYWQTLGLLVLSKILFSGFGKGGRHHKSAHWGAHWKAKWAGMTPEERERFKQKMKDKWCYRDEENRETKADISND